MGNAEGAECGALVVVGGALAVLVLGFVFAPIRTALHFGLPSGPDVIVPLVISALALLAFELLKHLGRRNPGRPRGGAS